MEYFLPSDSKSQLQPRSKINGQTAKFAGKYHFLQCWSEIIETNEKNGVVFDATSNEQPI